ncbi:MAG: DUF1573 domain-containing protein [Bacteroidota bacterium]
MKKLFFMGLTLIGFTVLAIAQQQEHGSAGSEIVLYNTPQSVCNWQSTTHEFGTIEQGKPVSCTYSFTNNGKEPLIVTSVQPACGCTTQSYSKEPVAPGKKGFVTLTYNAAATGKFSKSATVVTNSESFALTFTGEVSASAK